MVRADSHGIPRVPWYLRTGREPTPFAYRIITFCDGSFQRPWARVRLVTPWSILSWTLPALLPPTSIGLRATKLIGFGLFPFRSPLLRECYIFLGVLRCFTSPACLHPAYVFGRGYPDFIGMGCPIGESPVKLARQLTEAFRSLATPFFGS